MMTWASILLASAVPGPPTSYLVEGERDHQWLQFSEEDKGSAWIDVNWHETYRPEGAEYPSILLRYELKENGKPLGMGEMALAVDCKARTMASYDGWIEDYATGELYSRPEGPLDFDFATPPFDDNELFLFKHACGPEWTP